MRVNSGDTCGEVRLLLVPHNSGTRQVANLPIVNSHNDEGLEVSALK